MHPGARHWLPIGHAVRFVSACLWTTRLERRRIPRLTPIASAIDQRQMRADLGLRTACARCRCSEFRARPSARLPPEGDEKAANRHRRKRKRLWSAGTCHRFLSSRSDVTPRSRLFANRHRRKRKAATSRRTPKRRHRCVVSWRDSRWERVEVASRRGRERKRRRVAALQSFEYLHQTTAHRTRDRSGNQQHHHTADRRTNAILSEKPHDRFPSQPRAILVGSPYGHPPRSASREL